MSEILNIYCDESCHLENDGKNVMTLGALWCSLDKRKEICVRLRELKQKHGIPASTEVKFNKVSPAKITFYLDWLDYFFDDDDLHFRAVIVPDKSKLDHSSFGQSHDDWYYKMLFSLLNVLFRPRNRHRIYIDYKDSRGGVKAKTLHQILCNDAYDFDQRIIERVQPIPSHESELLQLCDLLIGIVGYSNRGLATSSAKLSLVSRMKERSGLSLTKSTLLRASKVNILMWRGGRNDGG